MSIATTSVPAAHQFTALQKRHLEHLARELNRKVGTEYTIHFDVSDDGRQWAMFETPGTAVLQVIAGGGSDGAGHTLVDAEGQLVSTLEGMLDYERLLARAKKFLVRSWRVSQLVQTDYPAAHTLYKRLFPI